MFKLEPEVSYAVGIELIQAYMICCVLVSTIASVYFTIQFVKYLRENEESIEKWKRKIMKGLRKK